MTLKKMQSQTLIVDRMPFTKRKPYEDEDEDENEFRVIYEGDCKTGSSIAISLDCIKSITLSPWLPKALSNIMKGIFEDISSPEKVKILHSTLVHNKNWIEAGKR